MSYARKRMLEHIENDARVNIVANRECNKIVPPARKAGAERKSTPIIRDSNGNQWQKRSPDRSVVAESRDDPRD